MLRIEKFATGPSNVCCIKPKYAPRAVSKLNPLSIYSTTSKLSKGAFLKYVREKVKDPLLLELANEYSKEFYERLVSTTAAKEELLAVFMSDEWYDCAEDNSSLCNLHTVYHQRCEMKWCKREEPHLLTVDNNSDSLEPQCYSAEVCESNSTLKTNVERSKSLYVCAGFAGFYVNVMKIPL